MLIIDEIYLMGREPHLHYRGTVRWYEDWLRSATRLRGQGMHGEIKNLRDLRRQAMKLEVRAGLRPVAPGSVDRVTRPTS